MGIQYWNICIKDYEEMQNSVFAPSGSNWLQSTGTLTSCQRNKLLLLKNRPFSESFVPVLPSCLFKVWHFSAQEAILFISIASPMRVSTGLSTEMKGHQAIKARVGCELALTTAGEKDGFVATGTWANCSFLDL